MLSSPLGDGFRAKALVRDQEREKVHPRRKPRDPAELVRQGPEGRAANSRAPECLEGRQRSASRDLLTLPPFVTTSSLAPPPALFIVLLQGFGRRALGIGKFTRSVALPRTSFLGIHSCVASSCRQVCVEENSISQRGSGPFPPTDQASFLGVHSCVRSSSDCGSVRRSAVAS